MWREPDDELACANFVGLHCKLLERLLERLCGHALKVHSVVGDDDHLVFRRLDLSVPCAAAAAGNVQMIGMLLGLVIQHAQLTLPSQQRLHPSVFELVLDGAQMDLSDYEARGVDRDHLDARLQLKIGFY